ncbi:MAG: universal stress protein [Halobacteriales archaeon]
MHVLVPMDDSPPSRAALEYALAEHPDADITVLHVVETSQSMSYGEVGDIAGIVTAAQSQLQSPQVITRAEQLAAEHDREVITETQQGAVAHTITTYASTHDVDQIIMGSHGRQGISRLLIGSVAERTVRRAPVPVTVV